MSGTGRRIVGHGGIYLLGSLLSRAVSFIMLPIYTRNLTPSDYGVLELLTMTIDLVGLLLSMRVGQSIYRYYFKYDDIDDRGQVIFSAYIMTIINSAVGMACVFGFSKQLALLVFGKEGMSDMIDLFSLSMLLQGMVGVPMVMLRVQQKPWIYLAASISKLVMQLCFNIYFIVYRRMHVEGIIYSGLIADGVMSFFLGMYLVKNAGYSFSKSKAMEIMSFSLPFMAVGALSFYLNFGDRYFLRLFGGGLDAVGLYSLGYKFGFLLIFIAGDPFSNVWDSEKFRIYRESPDPCAVYQRVFLVYSSVLAIVLLGLSLFGRNAIMVMAKREYWPAAELIPVVCLAYVCLCFTGYANLGILIKNRTIEYTYGSILAAVVVTAGYLVLIPRYGAMGAAWATLLAFGSRMIWVAIRSKKYYDMNLDWGRAIGIGAVVGAVWKTAQTLGGDSIPLSLMINTLAVIISLGALLFLPILPADLRKEARKWMLDPVSSLRTLKNAMRTK